MNKYKRYGWFNESHRHSMAARGIKTGYFARKVLVQVMGPKGSFSEVMSPTEYKAIQRGIRRGEGEDVITGIKKLSEFEEDVKKRPETVEKQTPAQRIDREEFAFYEVGKQYRGKPTELLEVQIDRFNEHLDKPDVTPEQEQFARGAIKALQKELALAEEREKS
jgi:hypothetical protein